MRSGAASPRGAAHHRRRADPMWGMPATVRYRGAYTGRKPALTTEQADALRSRAAAGEPKSMLAKEFGISRETVYSYLRSATLYRTGAKKDG
ncbi:helix-turn-helix domain-containing protein [Nocardia sp. NPDC052278]|uniref:helix-turn-helix domain-containing protein n=1 Tax=unclassified Nocardia TaxID=2637762 RepID=UPI0036779A04